MKNFLNRKYCFHRDLLESVMQDTVILQRIADSAETICRCLQSGGKVLLCGNGGSAADAMHITAEFVAGFHHHDVPLAAVCLNSDMAVLSALANDCGYRFVFSKQIEAIGKEGDVLVALTTSGKSENIIEALQSAKRQGLHTITLCGEDSSEIESEIVLSLPSHDTASIQEVSMFIAHGIAEYVENYFRNGEGFGG